MTAASTPTSRGLPPISQGSILAQKYRVERVLGQGGMGVVLEAWHIALNERVALKFLLPDYAAHREAAERFVREARAAVKIKGEHVCRVSDVGTLENDVPYIVMEYLDGSDLAALLKRQGVLPTADAIDFVIQGCEAIAEAHSHGIVHRDLKPANLFLTKRPDGSPLIKVLDFGISKITGESVDSLTRSSIAMGSALYMSPEQMQAARTVDHRTDIYALGVALFELLGGRPPFFAETLPQLCAEVLTGTPTPLRTLRPDIPDDLAGRIEKAYQRDRGMRYGSIAELVIALAPYAPARSHSSIERIARMAGQPVPAMPARGSWPDTAPNPSAAPAPPARGSWPDAASNPPAAGSAARGSGPDQTALLVGSYAGPASGQAALAFAGRPVLQAAAVNTPAPVAAGSTNSALATSSTRPAPPTRRPIVLAALALGALLGIGGAISIYLFRPQPHTPSSTAAAPVEAVASPGAAPPVVAPPVTSGPVQGATEQPAGIASGAGAAESTARPQASVAPPAPGPRSTAVSKAKAAAATAKPPPDKPPPPSGPSKPNDIFQNR